MNDPLHRIGELLGSANEIVLTDTVTLPKHQADELIWLQGLLQGKIIELQALQADIEGGLSLKDLGFHTDTEFEDMANDLEVQIRSLKTRILSLREVGR